MPGQRDVRAPAAGRLELHRGVRLESALQELYLEAILGSLIKRGFLSRKLDLLVSQRAVYQ